VYPRDFGTDASAGGTPAAPRTVCIFIGWSVVATLLALTLIQALTLLTRGFLASW